MGIRPMAASLLPMDTIPQHQAPTPRRRLVLRTAFLLLGAAIFVAFILLQIAAGTLLATVLPVPAAVVMVVIPMLLVGFLPGLREVEVAATRTLLGARGDLIIPEQPGWDHRWRSALWVLIHLLLGGVLGVALVGGIPMLISIAWTTALGQDTSSVPLIPQTDSAWPTMLIVLIMIIMVAMILGLVIAAGLWLMALAPKLLGPTWRDRIHLAQDRLQAEAEHRRLARDLHDGVGHALSIISLQAVAGRRVIESKPEQSAASLETIETTARRALDDLDHMLGVLREDPAPKNPERGIADLATLIEAHRQIGMDLRSEIPDDLDLPALLSTTTYRIVSEGLTNAQRYAAPGPVHAEIRIDGDCLLIDVRSPLPRHGARPATRRSRGGRGLVGINERAALFGGGVTSGVVDTAWVLQARLPTGAQAATTTRPRPNPKEESAP